MSQEHTNSFVAKIKEDPSLAEEIKGKNAKEVVEIAAKHGFTVTMPEVMRYHSAAVSQLSEDQLEELTGGGFCSFFHGLGDDVAHVASTVYHYGKNHPEIAAAAVGD